MKIIEVNDYQEMSKQAADYISNRVRKLPSLTLGLSTGGTPLGLYKNLIEDYKENHTSYQKVKTFNLDEYVGLAQTNPNSYRYYMNDIFFNHINIDKSKTNIPRGDVDDVEREALDYEQLIERSGGVDIQILGIGSNGHIGFNEPGTSFDSKTHIVELATSTREANARFFNNLEEVPTRAITMGIATIMKSKEILLLISGESKKEALANLMFGEIHEGFPASILRNHPAVTVIVDKAAIAESKVH
ncbi:glucosamine-6-phosphate deaminase [Alkalihalobacillus deserti]|uniref:glucosamine-6-phosphate deaminase n=1 Tax=Alkalihalobacillus deserti TaxID=2879466 RepID=UPI001D1343DC|nr:glucosamine-6-phosphate deaminase [Alkalihalobacillus deserti]